MQKVKKYRNECSWPGIGRVKQAKRSETRGLVEFGAPKIENAVRADIIFLALPFATVETFGPVRDEWRDKIVVDATNVYHVPPALAHGVDGGGLATGPQIRREGDSFHGPRMALNPSEPAIGYCQRSRQPAATKFSADTGEY